MSDLSRLFADVWDTTNHWLRVSLAASSSVIGKVSMNHATPGDTDGVVATGDVASGSADGSSKPVKVGGIYRVTPQTLADLQRGDLQLDVNGNLKVSQATLIAGEDLTNNVLKVEERFSYTNIATATTTTVKSGAGFLHSITVNTTAAGSITIYDNTAGSGTKIATLKASITENSYFFDVSFSTGLTIVTGAASDITASWR